MVVLFLLVTDIVLARLRIGDGVVVGIELEQFGYSDNFVGFVGWLQILQFQVDLLLEHCTFSSNSNGVIKEKISLPIRITVEEFYTEPHQGEVYFFTKRSKNDPVFFW